MNCRRLTAWSLVSQGDSFDRDIGLFERYVETRVLLERDVQVDP
jgi:hypothetical protein